MQIHRLDQTPEPSRRAFLFLQGPHGPFFSGLARKLADAGHPVERIAFNFADRHFWDDGLPLHSYTGAPEGWSGFLRAHVIAKGVTDLVLYGDSRPVHAQAREVADELGLRVHCFEEGYLRPYWATYERGGTNGHSALLGIPFAKMAAALGRDVVPRRAAPPLWGAVWHHGYYGFLYHFFAYIRWPGAPRHRPHRDKTIPQELWLHARRLAMMPWNGLLRRYRTWRLLRRGDPYFLVLLQLSHDASMRVHGGVRDNAEFITRCIAEFARSAPTHQRLVFKSHPFEDYREPIPRIIRDAARANNVAGRVDFLPGGKLGPLLDGATGAITVNSTAAQQALWRNLPVLAVGRSVFAREWLVAQQGFAEFFAAPQGPDPEKYAIYRQFLLESSQLPGGFYTRRGRTVLLRRVVDAMLDPLDPYEKRLSAPEKPRRRPARYG